MKRLEIALLGRSLALNELATELEQHGHCVLHLTKEQDLDQCLLNEACLLIEDQSLSPNPEQEALLSTLARLSLRVGSVPLCEEGLPTLELRCWFGTAKAQRLVSRLPLAAERSGNGRMLRDSAIATLVDAVAVDIGRLSRDAGYFLRAPTVDASHCAEQHGLQWLEPLAFDHRFNHTARPHLLALAEIPLVERLDLSFLRFVERTALNIAGRKITYGTLHAQSLAIQQRLLALLANRAAVPDENPPVIGICLPKSPALFAGILAILGSGAVYLPLDPSQPTQRQRYILENAGAVLLLHDGQHALGDQWPGLDISELGADDTDPTRSLMRLRPISEAPCMALYTSGTTGHPKGVMLSQRNLSHFTAWYAEHVNLSEHSRVLQFSTLSFDSSVIDIFPTLLSGAELVVPTEDQRRDPLLLISLIKQRISHAFLPPALLSILPLDQPLGLEHLMTGGDVCEPYVIERLAGQCHFYNLYGPTEATVLITSRLFEAGSNNRTLGKPIANSQIFILDEQFQPVPENTPGELFIAGPGVCLGYLNNPALTEERYPTLELPDGRRVRVYRTGDIGKWTAEGIELCGRRDNQVKIRGFRVEPEEIEHCLRASQLYRQVAVVIDIQRRILAFVAQPQGATERSSQALRAHVEQLLPDYMRPTAYTELMTMPFASNGKVDRKALLDLPVTVVDALPRRLPETLIEGQLLKLWAELLEMPAGDISTDESFFNLGGHSILLSQMLLSIREQFGRSISINRFIEAPTLLTLAALIDNDGTQSSAYTVSPQALHDANPNLSLTSVPVSQLGDVHKVVVTGANGFLGVHIVEALLAWGATEVVCLVREGVGLSANARFMQALRENRLDHLDLSRVIVYPADIGQPLLGLSPEVYKRIDRDFGALVHSAANVNHVQNYETLIKDNVEPIFECLRLCEGRSKKIFNFVSTLSASSAVDGAGNVLEQPAAGTPPIYIKNGYNLSKWVAERILRSAGEQGAWVNIYRPGNIAFNSVTGVCQPHKNRLMLMLKGSIQLGQVPEFSMNFDLMPVDFLARFIGFHASRYHSDHAVFNLHNPEPLSWSRYVAAFREAGREFQMVSVAQWQQQLSRVDSQNALFGVLGFYLDGFEEDIGDISMIEYENAQAGIWQMGERYPLKTDVLLRKGCDYLKEIDFI
ncbi:non-ribosomal peptide synthetase [Pseudomonas sp. CCI3.2]|uniref:non-ribosomal peptide synthetase n=1 Tax=unclassified Pseudomonas TaxID=196821 RepID=UPI002AC8C68D|nr:MULTISPECIES: non-ribosomal peptide synthetase [unclassified Pseudomonas]MEB0077733.1 non-ribosomal peptide synthetase [Pseudomonas sp. MH10out]MEB0102846.1 non-ribosomal peptide synthetase [Pseudomonas sp. CCI3.2]MEB0130739.1 non-ribosomal peptide synthetase [Pseudomonas sp. CCI2.4]MEB0160651.1 non-ribosomal peptide synthetase [Pseudomonas sp. AH2 (2023)]MEB0170138.1 non-ribosomal peptide synthetase [Pseudomonas sp. CCC4.4]